MRVRSLAAAAIAAGLTFVLVPGAGAGQTQITDAKGDGNAVNGQGFADGIGAATPVSTTSLDIASITWATKFTGSGKKKTPTDIIVTMEMAGPVATEGKSGVWRATSMVGGSCTFMLAYATYADGTPSSSLRVCDDADPLGYADYPAKAVVDGAKIVWTLPIKSLKAYGVKVGSTLDTLGGHTRLALGTSVSGGATVPQIDEATSDLVYKVGS